MTIARWMPGLAALRSYKASFLPHDLAAGVTLGAVLVPVGLAYGELAGLPMAGLYGSMLPLLAYFLFGSSRQVVVGPDSAMAAIVAVAVVPLAMGDPGRLAMLCATLGVMVGVLCIAAGLLRLGFVANFLSKPVIVGFMHGVVQGFNPDGSIAGVVDVDWYLDAAKKNNAFAHLENARRS